MKKGHNKKTKRSLTAREQQEQESRRNSLVDLSSYYTDEELAERVGTASGMISQMRNGTRSITDQMRERIEIAVGRPMGWMDRYVTNPSSSESSLSQHFREQDLVTLNQLMALPSSLREPIRDLIAGAYNINKKGARRKAEEPETA